MYGNQGAQRYRETDLATMSRERVVIMLYERMISDLEEAAVAIEAGDRSLFTQRINHSQRIVTELRGALDLAVGGEIARNLEAIYDFLFREHLSLLVDRQPGRARACADVLRPLLEAWRQVPQLAGEPGGRPTASEANAGADPATRRPAGEGLSSPPRPAVPEDAGARPSLLSVSA